MEKKIDIEAKWNENVALAKQTMHKRNANQMYIANLALEVCEITMGGPASDGRFTLKRFSDEAGCSPKSLSAWIGVKKLVYDKILDNEYKSIAKYSDLAHVATKVSRLDSPEKITTMLSKVINSDRTGTNIRMYLNVLRTINNTFRNDDKAKKIEKNTTAEILFYSKKIQQAIKSQCPRIKPADHNLAYGVRLNNVSASKAFAQSETKSVLTKDKDGQTLKITSKDRAVLNFIKKQNGFVSPTEIGMKIGGHNNNSASTWACRSLNKLMSLEMVNRNKFGHYKFVG